MSETFTPQAGDQRFEGLENFNITFRSTETHGWEWRAVNAHHYEARNAARNETLDEAIAECVSTLNEEHNRAFNIPRQPLGEPKGDLAKYLKKWDKKHGA